MPIIVLNDPLKRRSDESPLRKEDALLEVALSYWERLSEGQDMPLRDLFEPIGALELLPHSIFARVDADPATGSMKDGEIQMVGQSVRDRVRANLLGKRFLDVFGDESKSEIWNAYDAAQKNRCPVFLQQNYIGPAEVVEGTRELVLPFRSDDPSVNFVLVVIQFMTADANS